MILEINKYYLTTNQDVVKIIKKYDDTMFSYIGLMIEKNDTFLYTKDGEEFVYNECNLIKEITKKDNPEYFL